jgi:hypothetical protein
VAKIISMERRRRNSLPKDLPEEAFWEGTPGELKLVLAHRRSLMWTKPIMNEEITRLDKWLVRQPKLELKDVIEIWSRAMYCDWVFYGDAHPELKHLMLLRLRDHYREIQTLPQRWQEALSPMWEWWALEFLEEEKEEAANA